MTTSDDQKRAAYLGGRLAARTEKPITDCPYDAEKQQLLTVWFIRGYRSIAQDTQEAEQDDTQWGEGNG